MDFFLEKIVEEYCFMYLRVWIRILEADNGMGYHRNLELRNNSQLK